MRVVSFREVFCWASQHSIATAVPRIKIAASTALAARAIKENSRIGELQGIQYDGSSEVQMIASRSRNDQGQPCSRFGPAARLTKRRLAPRRSVAAQVSQCKEARCLIAFRMLVELVRKKHPRARIVTSPPQQARAEKRNPYFRHASPTGGRQPLFQAKPALPAGLDVTRISCPARAVA